MAGGGEREGSTSSRPFIRWAVSAFASSSSRSRCSSPPNRSSTCSSSAFLRLASSSSLPRPSPSLAAFLALGSSTLSSFSLCSTPSLACSPSVAAPDSAARAAAIWPMYPPDALSSALDDDVRPVRSVWRSSSSDESLDVDASSDVLSAACEEAAALALDARAARDAWIWRERAPRGRQHSGPHMEESGGEGGSAPQRSTARASARAPSRRRCRARRSRPASGPSQCRAQTP